VVVRKSPTIFEKGVAKDQSLLLQGGHEVGGEKGVRLGSAQRCSTPIVGKKINNKKRGKER